MKNWTIKKSLTSLWNGFVCIFSSYVSRRIIYSVTFPIRNFSIEVKNKIIKFLMSTNTTIRPAYHMSSQFIRRIAMVLSETQRKSFNYRTSMLTAHGTYSTLITVLFTTAKLSERTNRLFTFGSRWIIHTMGCFLLTFFIFSSAFSSVSIDLMECENFVCGIIKLLPSVRCEICVLKRDKEILFSCCNPHYNGWSFRINSKRKQQQQQQ